MSEEKPAAAHKLADIVVAVTRRGRCIELAAMQAKVRWNQSRTGTAAVAAVDPVPACSQEIRVREMERRHCEWED